MKVLEKENYKIKDWKLEVECTGKDWEQKQKPCHSLLELKMEILLNEYTISNLLWFYLL